MPASKFVTLNTRAIMPTLGFGTWKSKLGAVEHAVEFALTNGYRHVDTASAYGNEKGVGEGIRASGVPRDQIFLTTKLANSDHHRPEEALNDSLKKLGTDYLDLWLMHWPAPMRNGKADKSANWIDTWKEMERLYKTYPDKLKAIGISNVSAVLLEKLLPEATVIPAVNQIEMHPSCPQDEIVDLCTRKGIVIEAYSPLGSDNSPLLEHAVVKKIAEKHNVPPATVLISLQTNKSNVAVLSKSVTDWRILQNMVIIDLTPQEMEELHEIDKELHFRACTPAWTGWGHLEFPDLKQQWQH